ncbi:MAG: hypothetical protein A2288_00900 [Candidatus Moranbacteria bacterium RIFOXYA12_FULL_44_15]|nr:MAG: hypothetical protein A2288_00900 [Candidatus Moranbacteria bacterium RIFOXYA12_FULL_44_15]OGI36438.1 MAG: hypothetical protein A2259_00795 [Candidatus Moranbacteria bacterium RIFOXYA2_FULL_43_15]
MNKIEKEKVNDLKRQIQNKADAFDNFKTFAEKSLAIASDAPIFTLRKEVKKAIKELGVAADLCSRV